MQRVKIASSWTKPGGGTVAHINLCNLLNDNGYDCTFYGPHEWHLDKCKGANIKDMTLDDDDIVISHFLQPMKLPCKHILYCHEQHIYPLKEIGTEAWDLIVYVSNAQKAWQGVNHPNVIIPPVVDDDISWVDSTHRVAGVIGSIDQNKRTGTAISRAISDGYDRVLLFGEVTDLAYYNKEVAMHVEVGNAVLMGHEDDKEKMYNQVDAVYHASMSETFGLVEAECKLNKIPYVGPSYAKHILSKEEILERWNKVLS